MDPTAGVVNTLDSVRSEFRGARICLTDPQPQPLVRAGRAGQCSSAADSSDGRPGADVSAAVLAQALRRCVDNTPARALLVNSRQPTTASVALQAVAEQHLVPVVEMSDTLPDESAGYVAWMGANIDELAGALAVGSR